MLKKANILIKLYNFSYFFLDSRLAFRVPLQYVKAGFSALQV